jgi:hypothetical protein
MPDVNALFPAAPKPPEQMNPLQLLDAAGKVNALAAFAKDYQARQATGDAYAAARRPDGSTDFNMLATGLAAHSETNWRGQENASTILQQRGTDISNAQAQYDLTAKRQAQALDMFGSIADKPTSEGINTVAASLAARGVPALEIYPLVDRLRRAKGRDGYAAVLSDFRKNAIGATGTAQPVEGPPSATGAPTKQPLGSFLSGGTAGGATPVGLAPGVGEAQKAEAEAGQEAARGLQNAANEIPTQRTQLDLMRNDLAQAKTKFGPTAKYEKVANVIAGRVLGFHPTMSKEEIASLESFDKVARQIALSQAGSLHATDQTLHTALGANPNTDLSAFGNEGIINMLHGNADALAIKSREWNKARRAGTGPDKFYQWSDQFNQSFDPRVFQFMRMDTKQRAALLKNITDKPTFEQSLVDAERRGWITLPKE